MTSWVSVLAEKGLDLGFSGVGGHSLLAMNLDFGSSRPGVYEVFHMLGSRGPQYLRPVHTLYNRRASIERYRQDTEHARATSVGGYSGHSMHSLAPLPGPDWYKLPANTHLRITESPRLPVNVTVARNVLERCVARCALDASTFFSLPGADVGIGTNCISWAYEMLEGAGVTFDQRMYLWSFVSPPKAVGTGGHLEMMASGGPAKERVRNGLRKKGGRPG